MSAQSPKRQSTNNRDIPARRVLINDASQIPSDCCSTPGGTLFSTTPGGTRVIYDRAFLMKMRNSPIASTPPKNMPNIPGVTSPAKTKKPKENGTIPKHITQDNAGGDQEEPQFQMDL